MKKITLSIGLVAAMLSAKSQDTISRYVKLDKVYTVDYQADTTTNLENKESFSLNVKEEQALCLFLEDDKLFRTRQLTIVYPNGFVYKQKLRSRKYFYCLPYKGPFKAIVGESKFGIVL